MYATVVIDKKGEHDGGHWRIINITAKRRQYSFFEDEKEEWQTPLIEAQEGDTVSFYFFKDDYKGKVKWTIVGPDDPVVSGDRKLSDLSDRVEALEAGMADFADLAEAVEKLQGGAK